jgi:hypothetical protein
MRKLAFFLFVLLSSNLYAQWFQANATTSIINENIDKARQQAIKKAVKEALLYSGTSLSNLQQLNHIILQDKRIILNTGGEIKGLQIVNEVKNDKTLFIDIKVDIVPNKQQCIGRQFPKSMMLSRFALNVPEQTVHGQIYDLHKKVSEVFYNELSLNPYLFNVRNYIDMPLKLGEKYNNKDLVDTLHSLSVESDSQFIIYGEINDLSVNFELEQPERYFYMTVYVYDAFQGQLLFSKQYRQKSIWEYQREELVDLKSKTFWETQYGESILNGLDQANADISQKVQCILPRARVVAVDNNTIQINLGRRNGLKKDTRINLSYSSNFKDQFGIERNSFSISQQEMEVVAVHENSAVLTTLDKYPLSNIQIDDIAQVNPIK